ncbi:4-hydroxy-3-methylbut-2-enyl diphosphate reductase [candidate division WOR-3 bacterium]|nr:4-hydroxy-3-methylbut-2-enyl diphosphate reductase [candidate division WOR-3 bacterium]
MFKIILAEKAGFCFGVKRAMAIAEKTAKFNSNKPTYTFGPLIHNPQAVSYLESMEVRPIHSLNDVKPGKLIVRSHGLPPQIITEAKEKGFEIIDATCPFVRRTQDFAKTLLNENYEVVLIGEADHPEVIGIAGHTNGKAIIIENESDLKKLTGKMRIGIVSQTTQSLENFKNLVMKIRKIGKEVKIYNTICRETQKRQKSALMLAKKADIMFIIGSKNSANTTHLAQLSQQTGKPTYHIEKFSEISPEWLKGKKIIGISAGASTPSYVIKDVITYLKSINNKISGPRGPRLLHKEEVFNG